MSPAWITVSASGLDDLVRCGGCAGRRHARSEQQLGLLCRGLADRRPVLLDADRRADRIDARPCRDHPLCLLAAALLFVALARGLDEIDAEQGRTDHRNDDGRADRAEDVSDRIGDRHHVQHRLDLVGGQTEAVDRVSARPIDAEIVCEPA